MTLLGPIYDADFDAEADDPAGLDAAVDLVTHAAGSTDDDHPGLNAMLVMLGRALSARFDGDGALTDLDEVIEVGLCTVALTTRYEHSGTGVDIDDAVSASRAARPHHSPVQCRVAQPPGHSAPPSRRGTST